MYCHFNKGDFAHNRSGSWMSPDMPRVKFEDWAVENLSKKELLALWLGTEERLTAGRERATGKDESIQSVLRALASQENCDGEPYSQMIAAADYIDTLESDSVDRLMSPCSIQVPGSTSR